MNRRAPLASSLGTAFRVQDAREAGASRGRLRAADLTAPFVGIRRRVSAPGGPLSRVRDYAPLLRPGDRFSHVSAALIWSAPLPAAIPVDVVHVTSAIAGQARSRGVVGHRSALDASTIRHGLPVSTPERLFLELASVLGVGALVAVGDHLVLDPWLLDPADLRPWTTPERLVEAAAAFRGRGGRCAREAAAQVRVGAESPKETELRLLLARHGLVAPRLNVDVLDDAGRWIGRFDLVWPRERVAVEYDGDHHRTDRRQYEIDVRRLDRAADAAWRVVRVRSAGLRSGAPDTVARVRRAIDRGANGPPGRIRDRD